MKRVIGIVGGVGAGKSCVLSVLEEAFHAQVIQADLVARELMEPKKPCFEAVVGLLGREILDVNGEIDRPAMARILFSDAAVKKAVDDLTHPPVWEEISRRIAASDRELIAVEAAVLEEEFRDKCGEMWYVYTSKEHRIERLMKGRGYDRTRCEDMIASQADDAAFRAFATDVIDNNDSPESTRKQVRDLILRDREE